MLFLQWKKLFVPRSTSKELVIEKKRTLYSVVLLRCVFPMLLTTPSHTWPLHGSSDNFNSIGHSISFTCSTCIDFPFFWLKFTTYHVNIVTFSYSVGKGNFSVLFWVVLISWLGSIANTHTWICRLRGNYLNSFKVLPFRRNIFAFL